MYAIDPTTRIEIEDVPPPLPGAPSPQFLATETKLLLTYFCLPPQKSSKLCGVTVVSEEFSGNLAIIEFKLPLAYMSLPISNETISAHTLYSLGVASGSVYRVEGSPWLTKLSWMLAQASSASRGNALEFSHYLFAFHDTVFEIVAGSYVVRMTSGTMSDGRREMIEILESDLGSSALLPQSNMQAIFSFFRYMRSAIFRSLWRRTGGIESALSPHQGLRRKLESL